MGFSAFFGNTVSTFFAKRPEAAAYRNIERRADPPGQADSGKVPVLRDRKLRSFRTLCRLPRALWTPLSRLALIRQHASAVLLRATGTAAHQPLGIPQSAGDWRQLCASDLRAFSTHRPVANDPSSTSAPVAYTVASSADEHAGIRSGRLGTQHPFLADQSSRCLVKKTQPAFSLHCA